MRIRTLENGFKGGVLFGQGVGADSAEIRNEVLRELQVVTKGGPFLAEAPPLAGGGGGEREEEKRG